MRGTPYRLDVVPAIPERLKRLEDLAGSLWYSWDRPTRSLFARLNPVLWQAVGHSPKAFLRSIDQKRLLEAANRRTADLDRAAQDVVDAFNALREAQARRDEGVELQDGDRSGRYLSRQYFQRRQALELDVQAAQARLDQALARRNALR